MAAKAAYFVYGFVLENSFHQLGYPLFVGLRRSCVPAIQTVKLKLHARLHVRHGSNANHVDLLVPYLDTADIATTTFEKLVIRVAYFL